MKTLNAKSETDIRGLMDVALGRRPADLVVTDAELVNVYTGEIIANQSVAVKGEWIAYVGRTIEKMIGPGTKVVEAEGKTLIPGLIDAHTHIAWLYSSAEFIRCVAPGGTTLVVTEALEPYPVSGIEGVLDFLDSLRHQPIKVFATAPAMVSISTAARGIKEDDLDRLLSRPEILGLGESYWQEVVRHPEVYLPAIARTQALGKTIEGHSAGAADNKLNAYIAAGIASCHEPINTEQVLAAIRLGLRIMIREGSIRRDLAEIAAVKDAGVDLRRLILVTDSLSAEDLLEKGYMDYVVQKAVNCGFDPVSAIQMATLNPAEHFGLDRVVGGIAPGRYADMVLIPDARTIRAETVISSGRIVAREGEMLAAPRTHRYRQASLRSIIMPAEMKPADFAIPVSASGGSATVRVIEMVTDLVTREIRLETTVRDGHIPVDPETGLAKVAAIDRTHNPGRRFVGLLKGFGLKEGAMACSAAWDTSDIVVVGTDEGDMAAAVNRIRSLQGGALVVKAGRILAEVPLPVFGIASTAPMERLRRDLNALSGAARGLGVPFPDPLLSLITLTGAAIPFLRICEEGLVNLKDGQTVGLFVGG